MMAAAPTLEDGDGVPLVDALPVDVGDTPREREAAGVVEAVPEVVQEVDPVAGCVGSVVREGDALPVPECALAERDGEGEVVAAGVG